MQRELCVQVKFTLVNFIKLNSINYSFGNAKQRDSVWGCLHI